MWRNPTLAGAVAIASQVVAPSLARADVTYSGQRPAGSLVQSAAVVAQEFWRERGVMPCADPAILIADDLSDTDAANPHGRAARQTCTLWILREDVTDARWELRPHHGGDALEGLCTTVAHEMGHLAGLEHTERGVMATEMPATPYACVKWAHAQHRAAVTLRKRR